MLAIIRLLKNLRDKEHYLRTRYQKDHPHFYRFIALDAILTVLLVGGTYGIATGHGFSDDKKHRIMDFGGVAMDLEGVRAQANEHKVTFYWIGSVGNLKYTTNIPNSDEIALNYVPANTEEPKIISAWLSVTTYSNLANYRKAPKGPIALGNQVTIYNSMGDLLTYDKSDLRKVTVALAKSPEVVALLFRTAQSENQLLKYSEKIVPLI